MKKVILFLLTSVAFLKINAQDIKICHKDVDYFIDTISYELKDQLPDGMYKVYFDSEKKILGCSGEILNHKRTNKWAWYYDSGKMSITITYLQGIQSGTASGWYTSGTKLFEGTYLNGNPSGTWKFYKEDGSLFKEDIY